MRRLTIAKAITPSIKPAIIDSHGNPVIAGNVIGVETEIVVELLVVVGVLTIVIVETEVLTTVVVSELVVVTDIVEALDEVKLVATEELELVLELVLEAALEVELEVVLVVACCPTTGGTVGSRWKMAVRGSTAFVVVGCVPTAQPSVGLVVKTEYSPMPEVIGMGHVVTSLHPAPLNHAVNAFPLAS